MERSHSLPGKENYPDVEGVFAADEKFDSLLRADFMVSDDATKNLTSARQVHLKHHRVITEECGDLLAPAVESAWRCFIDNTRPRFVPA